MPLKKKKNKDNLIRSQEETKLLEKIMNRYIAFLQC